MQSGIVKWCVYILFVGAGFAASDRAADAQTTGSPSFNCALARSEVEHLICALPSLQAKDNAMSRQYAATLAQNPDNSEALKKAQISWWRRRNACVGSAVEMADCVGRSYDTRMTELGGSTATALEATVEPKTLAQADVSRLHDEIGQYAQSHKAPTEQVRFCEIINDARSAYDPLRANYDREANGIAQDRLVAPLAAIRAKRDNDLMTLLGGKQKLRFEGWVIRVSRITTSFFPADLSLPVKNPDGSVHGRISIEATICGNQNKFSIELDDHTKYADLLANTAQKSYLEISGRLIVLHTAFHDLHVTFIEQSLFEQGSMDDAAFRADVNQIRDPTN